MNRTLVVDLEAVAIDGCEQYLDPLEPLEPPDLDAIRPAANLIDPAKILVDVSKRREAALRSHAQAIHAQAEKRAAAIARCSLDPDLAAIRAIGTYDGSNVVVAILRDDAEEVFGLESFWRGWFALGEPRLTSFNGFGYDFPLLMRRSLYLGVKCPSLNLDRYRSPHIDLMQKLSFNGAIKAHSLRFYAKRLGISVEDETRGSDIGRLVAEGKWDAIRAHCESDVKLTAEIARRLGYLTAAVPVPEATGAF